MKVLIVLMCLTLASCAAPRGYKQMPWAKMSPQQAEAECDAQRKTDAGGSQYHCMRAKGWEPYY